MTGFKTQLSVLRAGATSNPSAAVLKIPKHAPGKRLFWKDVSYSAFLSDVEKAAAFWIDKLRPKGAGERSVVGVWVKGTTYSDLVHTWGLSRAGFIPQLFSLRMTDPSVVYELLQKADAVALVHDASFSSFLNDAVLPTFAAEDVESLDSPCNQLSLPLIRESSDPEEVHIICHTSGSTSGVPKLVPVTARWLDSFFNKIPYLGYFMPQAQDQQVMTAIGSFMHMGSNFCLWECLALGACVVLPTAIPYSSMELNQMIDECGVTKLAMFPPALSNAFHDAEKDPILLERLRNLDVVIYAGMALDAEDEKWARNEGIRCVNMFGATETGFCLCSRTTYETFTPALQPFPSSIFEFIPLEDSSETDMRLLELVISPDSPDCPAANLRSSDGKFHTGDLFIEAEPGTYLSQGRADSWIKMETALRCNTDSIEANATQTCGSDLIDGVVVIGAGRPSPVMVVEPRDGVASSSDGNLCDDGIRRLKNDILERIAPFHRRRYMHERIVDTRFILVVPKGSLPRTATKGNVRKKLVEEMLKGQLDQIFHKI